MGETFNDGMVPTFRLQHAGALHYLGRSTYRGDIERPETIETTISGGAGGLLARAICAALFKLMAFKDGLRLPA